MFWLPSEKSAGYQSLRTYPWSAPVPSAHIPIGIAHAVCAGASVAVACAARVCSPKPHNCMNQGAMRSRLTAQRAWRAPAGALSAAAQADAPCRSAEKRTATCVGATGSAWKSTRWRAATARPAASARRKAAAGMAGAPASSWLAASAQASAAFCSSVFVRYRRPPSMARPAKPSTTASTSATSTVMAA